MASQSWRACYAGVVSPVGRGLAQGVVGRRHDARHALLEPVGDELQSGELQAGVEVRFGDAVEGPNRVIGGGTGVAFAQLAMDISADAPGGAGFAS